MKIEYKRDLNSNYMVVNGLCEEEKTAANDYRVGMIVSNKIPNMLKCNIRIINGELNYYYEITSRQPMNMLYEKKNISYKELRLILKGILGMLDGIEEYLLDYNDVLFGPEYIYMDVENNEPNFVYVPENNSKEGFEKLTEYFLEKIEHNDTKAVAITYELYRRFSQNNESVKKIIKELLLRFETYQDDEDNDMPKLKYNALLGYKKSGSSEKNIFGTRFSVAGYGEGSSDLLDTRYTYGGEDTFAFMCNIMTNAGFDAEYNTYKPATCNGVYNINQKSVTFKQKTRVYLENANGTFAETNGNEANIKYNDIYSWSRAEDAIYENASVNAYTVTQNNTNNVYIKRKSNVSAGNNVNGTYVNGWYRGLPTITFTGNDSNLNIQSVNVNGNVTNGSTATVKAGKGINIYNYNATNIHGVSSPIQTLVVKADVTAPAISNVRASDGVITATLSDEGSGVAGYAVTTSSSTPTSWNLPASSISYKANSSATYYIHVKDGVGYTSSVSVRAEVDNKAPVVTYNQPTGWYKGSADVIVTASDDMSNITDIYTRISGTTGYTDNKKSGSKRASHTVRLTRTGSVQAYAKDERGNASTANSSKTFYVDNQAPTISDISISKGIINAKLADSQSGVAGYAVTTSSSTPTSWNKPASVISYKIDSIGIYYIHVKDAVGYTASAMVDVDESRSEVKAQIISEAKETDESGTEWADEKTYLEVTAKDDRGLKFINVNKTRYETGNVKYHILKVPYYQEGENIFTVSATDIKNNTSADTVCNVNIDAGKPELLQLIPSVTEWSADRLTLTLNVGDSKSGLKEYTLYYRADEKSEWEVAKVKNNKDDTDTTDATYKLSESEQGKHKLAKEVIIEKNGYYKLSATDQLEHTATQSDNEALHITNIDNTGSVLLGLVPDTTEWVNEATGVKLMASADNSEASGISSIAVMGDNGNGFEQIYIDEKKEISKKADIQYNTHKNGKYKTEAKTGAGNSKTMEDEEALEVTNIDSLSPKLTINTDSEWAREEDGKNIYVNTSDEHSGLGSVILERLNEESGEYEEYAKARTANIDEDITNEVNASTDIQMTDNNVEGAFIQGTNEAQDIIFNVKKSGTYRIVSKDMVDNETASTEAAINISATGSLKVWTEGNPTEWTNKDALINIYAESDNEITKICIDGESIDFEKAENKRYEFSVEENGIHKINVTDKAGNEEEVIVDVTKIDKEAPKITYKYANDWKDAERVITVTVQDSLSGVESIYVNDVYVKLPENDLKEYTFSEKIKSGEKYTVTVKDMASNDNQELITAKVPDTSKVIKDDMDNTGLTPPTDTKKDTDDDEVKPPTDTKKDTDDDTVKPPTDTKKDTDEGEVKPPTDTKKDTDEGEVKPPTDTKKDTDEDEVKPPTDTKKDTDEGEVKPPTDTKKDTDEGEVKPPTDTKKDTDEDEVKPPTDTKKDTDEDEVKPPTDTKKDTDESKINPPTDTTDNKNTEEDISSKVTDNKKKTTKKSKPDITDDDIEPEEIEEENEEETEEENINPIIDNDTPNRGEKTGSKGGRIGRIVAETAAASGFLFIFIFFVLGNVKIYGLDTDGEFIYLGRSMALRKKDYYRVKINGFVLRRAGLMSRFSTN